MRVFFLLAALTLSPALVAGCGGGKVVPTAWGDSYPRLRRGGAAISIPDAAPVEFHVEFHVDFSF